MNNTKPAAAVADDDIVTVYTDGACRGNPGRGGWGVILSYKGRTKEMSGGEPITTNNRMELTAAIRGLEALKRPCRVHLYSDSKYLIDAVTLGWAEGWRARGWRKADKSEAKNPDLWERIYELTSIHKVKFVWIKGHNGHPYNERCDTLATAYADSFN